MKNIVFSDKVYSSYEIEDSVNDIINLLKNNNINGVVALYMERDVVMLETIYALYEMGIAFLPLDITVSDYRNTLILKNNKIEIIITNCECNLKCCNMINIKKVSTIDNIYINYNYNENCINNKTVYLIATSGTTGIPKIVDISKKGFEGLKSYVEENFEFLRNGTLLSLSDYCFDMFMLETLVTRNIDVNIVLASCFEQKNPYKILRLIEQNNVDILIMTPSRFDMIEMIDSELDFLKNVKVLIFGGEILNDNVLKKIKEKSDCRIFNIYGPTETTIFCTYSELTFEKEVHIGKPFGRTEIRIMNNELNDVKEGEIGEIYVGGDSLANGYFNDIVLTKLKFVDLAGKVMYKTGDLGRCSNGNIFYEGRVDNQIKLHGYRIELEEIENYIKQIAGIRSCIVCYKKIAKSLIAYCIFEEGYKFDKKYIVQYLNDKIPEYMIPSEICVVKEFIYTTSGKIDRNTMVESFSSAKNRDTVNTRNINERISLIISDILVREYCLYDEEEKIKDIGMDSLTYVGLIVKIESEFGITFTPEELSIDIVYTFGMLVNLVIKKINEMDNL